MCYSAQIDSQYKKYKRRWGADISKFVRLYWDRSQGSKAKIPKAVDAMFAEPADADEREIARLIAEFNAAEESRLQQELFKQRKRVADAVRTLQTKTTKKAQDDQRIGSEKVQWCLDKIAGLKRTELVQDDMRIFPGWYAPVMVIENGTHTIKPMLYQCRLPSRSKTDVPPLQVERHAIRFCRSSCPPSKRVFRRCYASHGNGYGFAAGQATRDA